MGVEIRTRTEPTFDGSTGAQTGESKLYELGQEINGVWVAFVTKAGDYIDALVDRGQAAQQAGQQSAPAAQPAPADQPTLSPAAQQVSDQAQQTPPADTQGV